MNIITELTRELSLKEAQVISTVKLIDEGNTIPFIARYRKEVTGSLDDNVLRELYDRLKYLRSLEEKKMDIINNITQQGKITDVLSALINNAKTLTELEDIYRPYKQKRRTRATIAKEKGLNPLADIFLLQKETKLSPEEVAKDYINKDLDVNNEQEAILGALDIVAEIISDEAKYRKFLREKITREGFLKSKGDKDKDSVYSNYYDFKQEIRLIQPHKILAINRGEAEKILSVSLECNEISNVSYIKGCVIINDKSTFVSVLESSCEDAYKRLIYPSIEREIRNELTDKASEQAIKIFGVNLKNLLLTSPLKGKIVLGLDPAYRTGCKLAVVDETGKPLYTGVIFPTPPANKVLEASKIVVDLIKKYKITIVAIGNGTASKESEIFISNIIKENSFDLTYAMVSESGASVYSASKLGAEEFPELDVSYRSAISIARRLQDPLAELVKIDPKAIGVGQYQHDMKSYFLDETLEGVVENCVNTVGVDANTASYSLLSYIAGINKTIAKNIVLFREEVGKFKNRKELKKVSKLGAKAFEQCAGFLRISESENVLDNTSVHPESYQSTLKLLKILGYDLEVVSENKGTEIKRKTEEYGLDKLALEINIGIPTLLDILEELSKPGRDIRDELPKPELRSDLLDIKDLKQDMVLTGTVRNVIDFGAFVDIGVHQDGLIHISEISDRFIKHPSDILSVGDILKVRVVSVDIAKKRIALSLKNIYIDS
ncbi:MAG: Tex family protein [Clostridia bacterium]